MSNNAQRYATRSLYEESRQNLCDKISANIQSTGSICRQIVKGSKTTDILSNTTKSFASCDSAIQSTETNIKKIGVSLKHFAEQLDQINRMIDDSIPKTF